MRIRELRPLGLTDVETLVEVNNPQLKALASQVEQAQSALRAQIAQWYPSISLNANNFPTYTGGQQFRNDHWPVRPDQGEPPSPASGRCR